MLSYSLIFSKSTPRLALWCLIYGSLCHSTISTAATTVNISQQRQFFYKIGDFRSNLNVPFNVKTIAVTIPEKQISARLSRFKEDPRIEPIQFTISAGEDRILDFAGKIAQPGEKLALANYLSENFSRGETIAGTSLRLVTLTPEAFKLVQPGVVNEFFAKRHHQVSVDSNYFASNPSLVETFIAQLSPFLRKSDLLNVKAKIQDRLPLSLDRDLVPQFARQRIGKHTVFKGPNCFHAALAFQSDQLASSSLINVRDEKGYHRNMLNYDELWRALQLSFYEINPTQTALQYGDMIVFFESDGADMGPVDFKALRHAATYLMGGYVFSKGSKSANSPYIVGTLGEEWETWTKYTNKLGAKVFRRSLKSVTTRPPVDSVDWVY